LVERALHSQSVKKAPSPDKFTLIAIRMLWKWNNERILSLGKVAIRMGRNPGAWKRTSEVDIRKPGKDHYTKLKAHRTLLLFSCIRRVVEKVAAELLSEDAERKGLLNDEQFGSRKSWSAIDAVAIMNDKTHNTWLHGNILGVLFMDIKAPFLSLANGRLVNVMKEKRMDGDFI
jgi:hypothetical protein